MQCVTSKYTLETQAAEDLRTQVSHQKATTESLQATIDSMQAEMLNMQSKLDILQARLVSWSTCCTSALQCWQVV